MVDLVVKNVTVVIVHSMITRDVAEGRRVILEVVQIHVLTHVPQEPSNV